MASAVSILGCSSVNEGTGGNGGGSGSAGTGGVGGTVAPLCVEATGSCESREVDPIVEDPSCTIEKPPVQPSACEGTESLVNPPSCARTGTTVTYQLTLLEIAEDCNAGYDLDDCNGNSCLSGDIAPGEGADGVDNALAGIAPLIEPLGGDLGGVSQAFYDAICEGRLDVRFEIDSNPEQRCASITTYVDDEFSGDVIVNRSEAGCLSGTLGNVLLTLGGDITRELGNVRFAMTMTDEGLSDGLAGATLDLATAAAIASEFIGLDATGLIARLLDIDEEFQGDPERTCNALSASLRLGGVASP